MTEKIVFKEESFRIIGACFEVYKDKGSGFLEAVYQECLALEFTGQGIPFGERPRLRLGYKGHELQQTYEPDFMCFGGIILKDSPTMRHSGERGGFGKTEACAGPVTLKLS